MDVPEKQKQHVRKLILDGSKILAIKYLNKNFGLALKDAKKMADLIEQDIINDGEVIGQSKDRTTPDLSGCIVGKIFLLVSFVLLGFAAYFFIGDYQLISNGEKVIATVISDPSKPVFEYEVLGEFYTYESRVTSTPPSYYLGEEVTIFVNPNEPYEILIDTFTDRWLAITILGSMGLIFFFVGFVASKLFGKTRASLQK